MFINGNWMETETSALYYEKAVCSLDIAGMHRVEFERRSAPHAVVLGQCFSIYGDFAQDVELDFYVDMVSRMRPKEYELIWKEDPRTPFLYDLIAACPGIRGLPVLGAWLIELHVERLGLGACASLTSTELFSISLRFGSPSCSAAARFAGPFRFPNDELARLVMGSIPQIDGGAARANARPITTAQIRRAAVAAPLVPLAREDVA
jgi:hypothetical protein